MYYLQHSAIVNTIEILARINLHGKIEIIIDKILVGTKKGLWFSYCHEFTISNGEKVETGFVYIKTYILNCKTAIKIIFEGKVISIGCYRLPVSGNFLELGIFVGTIGLSMLIFSSVNLPFNEYNQILELGIMCILSLFFTKSFSKWNNKKFFTMIRSKFDKPTKTH